MPGKYNNKSLETEDGSFDSKKEYMRYKELKELEHIGAINDLKRQVKFELIPSQPASEGTMRSVSYVADFTYSVGGKLVVEDVKPGKKGNIPRAYKRTSAWATYQIKKKLMMYIHNIEVREI